MEAIEIENALTFSLFYYISFYLIFNSILSFNFISLTFWWEELMLMPVMTTIIMLMMMTMMMMIMMMIIFPKI